MKKILVIFPNEWLAYTPTLLNLISGLRDSFEIKVVATDNGSYRNEELEGDEFEFISLKGSIGKTVRFLGKILGNQRPYELLKGILVYRRAHRYQADEIIAVDALGLFLAQKMFPDRKTHFLSLEPYKNFLFKRCNTDLIDSAIAQTQERYDYLFDKQAPIKTFLIQNAPVFQEQKIRVSQPQAKKAIYFGSAIPRNGIYYCLEAIAQLSDLSLTIKGTMSEEVRNHIQEKYSSLLATNRIAIDNQYVKQEEIVEYLSEFYVGFCFYDLSCTDEVTRFNFVSVPSGKLFNYYAAGVPVIGSDLLGLKSVRDFQAGLLIDDISADNIIEAIKTIDERQDYYRQNCYRAAREFDFNKALEPFKEYLITK